MNNAETVVERSAPFILTRSDTHGDGLTLAGYAAVFNSVTRIDSYEGRFDEVISPGAFRYTLQNRTPVLQFDHGQHPLVGSIPIGNITTAKEDARGVYVEARLHDNWLTQPVRDAIASGAIDGMSFRFSVPKGKDTWDRSGDVPLRTIHEVRCLELGPVVFPAYAETSVAVRSLFDSLDPDARHEVVRELYTEAYTDPAYRAELLGEEYDPPAGWRTFPATTNTTVTYTDYPIRTTTGTTGFLRLAVTPSGPDDEPENDGPDPEPEPEPTTERGTHDERADEVGSSSGEAPGDSSADTDDDDPNDLVDPHSRHRAMLALLERKGRR